MLAAVLFLTPCHAAQTPPSLSAKSAILMDADSGRVLLAQNADARSRIASTTKILTGLLVCEQMALEKTVCVPKEAVGLEGSSMYLAAGEQITVRELLYGLLLRSGNDAAAALAILCDGSAARFAERMNARAAQLGMENSHFCNPSGLDEDGHFSTARDLALLTRAALRNAAFREAVGTKCITLGSRVLENHNRLLWRYPGANGVKTGYTRAAGRIAVDAHAPFRNERLRLPAGRNPIAREYFLQPFFHPLSSQKPPEPPCLWRPCHRMSVIYRDAPHRHAVYKQLRITGRAVQHRREHEPRCMEPNLRRFLRRKRTAKRLAGIKPHSVLHAADHRSGSGGLARTQEAAPLKG